MFYLIFLWEFFLFWKICREWKSLGASAGKYDGYAWNQYFFPAWFLRNVAMCYHKRSTTFLTLDRFHWFSFIRCNSWECKSAFSVWFELIIVIKGQFFVICFDILEKQVIALPWKKKTYLCRYEIFPIKSMRNTNAQLAHVSNVFQVD